MNLTRHWLWLLLLATLLLSGCEAPSGSDAPTSGQAAPPADLSPNRLDQARIGVIMGTLMSIEAEKRWPGSQILNINNTSDLVLAIKSGKVDAGLFDSISARALMHVHPELALLEDKLFSYPLGIGFNRNRAELRARFDHFLAAFRADGRYAEMYERWFEGDPEQVKMPERRAEAPRERYVLGLSVADLPYVAFKDGRYIGFDVELLQAFAVEENIELAIESLDFSALIPALAAGKVDIIADGIGITAERAKSVDFAAPYAEGHAVAVALKRRLAAQAGDSAQTPERLASLDDLAQGRLAVFSGTAQDLFATKRFPEAEIRRFNSTADFVLALKTGKVDAAVTDEVHVEAIVRANPDLAILADDFFNTSLGAAFRKGDREWRPRFERFLSAVQADGTLETLRRRWFVAPSAAVMPDIPRPTTGPTVRVGISYLVGLPYVSQADGEPIGYDIELLHHFAAREGVVLDLVPMEFDALMAALAVGKVDMIVSSLSITEERQTKVDFSQPYGQERSAVLVQSQRLAATEERRPSAPTTSAPGQAESHADMSATAQSPGPIHEFMASVQANFILEQRWKLILSGLWATVLISVASTLVGTALGALICWLRLSPQPALCLFGAGYIFLIRGLPVLLLLLLIFYVAFASVDIDPLLVAIIAFGMNFAAYVSEMFRSGIESIDRGQTEAGIAMGFTRMQTFLHIVLPQAVRRILPVYRGEFISLVKMTSIVGYIGVQDLTKAGDIIRSRTFEAFFPLIMVAALYFLVIWILGLALDAIDRRTDPKRRAKAGADVA